LLPAKNRQQVCSPPPDAKMNWHILILFCVLSVGVCRPRSIRAADDSPYAPRDLASEVRDVFAAKCAGCHGSDLAKPKGRFGYVLDLVRVASNPEMVVPFRPSESELWELVQHGEMPPADAPTGALTAQQKEVIRSWIASGAPAVPYQPPPGTSPSITRPHEGTAGEPLPMPLGKRILRWLGKFHILTIHFPIALLLAASIGEMWSMWRGARNPSSAVRFCVLLGAAGGALALVLGWLHADFGGEGAGSGRILGLHRWIGTVAGLWALATALFSERDAYRHQRSFLFRITLWTGTLLMGAAGHLGGTLVHGDDFFNW
jgi:mono/diheme cytochrome c family protein